MAIPDVLRRLLTAPGPSGYEAAPAAVFRAAAVDFAQVAGDAMGSSTALVPGTRGGLRLAVIGHVDEIGLIVTHVSDDGYLWFHAIGGWDAQIIVGQRVELLTRAGAILGVVGRKPIHLLREDDRKRVAEPRELHIDIGARDGAQARELVAIGDVAVIAGEPVSLPNRRVASRSLDNRLGSFVAFEVARRVAERGGAPGDVVAVAAVQEETTFAGARTATHTVKPDVAVVVDVTHATDVPGVEVRELGSHALGSGAVLNRGSTLHPAVFRALEDAARAEGVPYTVEASAGRTGTDADAVHLLRAGIPTGVVSVPLRYMHSPVELCQLDDVEAAARLVAAFARRLEPGTTFER